MTQDFAKDFVFHRHIGLAPNVIAELDLNHHYRGFDVARFMVMLEELLSVERKIMEHLLPSTATICTSRGLLEGDVGRRIDGEHGFQITNAGIPFVSQDLVDLKMLRGLVNQRRQQRGIVRVLPLNFNCRNDIRFDTAHDGSLNRRLTRSRFLGVHFAVCGIEYLIESFSITPF